MSLETKWPQVPSQLKTEDRLRFRALKDLDPGSKVVNWGGNVADVFSGKKTIDGRYVMSGCSDNGMKLGEHAVQPFAPYLLHDELWEEIMQKHNRHLRGEVEKMPRKTNYERKIKLWTAWTEKQEAKYAKAKKEKDQAGIKKWGKEVDDGHAELKKLKALQAQQEKGATVAKKEKPKARAQKTVTLELEPEEDEA